MNALFDKIIIDVIGPLSISVHKYKFCIAVTDYSTQWAEVRPFKWKTKEEIGKFIYKCIFLKHRLPKEIVIDQGLDFSILLLIVCVYD